MTYEITITGPLGEAKSHRVEITGSASDGYQYRVDGKVMEVNSFSPEADVLSLLVGGKVYEALRDSHGDETQITIAGQRYVAEVSDPRSFRGRKAKSGAGDGPKKITAPMPGKVVRILTPVDTQVEAGQGVIVIEAMKMQNELKSPKKGVIKKMLAAEGATVNAGDTLAVVE